MNRTPQFLTIELLASELSVSQQTVENWVEQGILPPARKPAGRVRLWKWKEVEKAMDRLVQQEERAPLSAEDIKRATREAAARH